MYDLLVETQLLRLKAKWPKISDKTKPGSGLASEKEPLWYKILNLIFTETN